MNLVPKFSSRRNINKKRLVFFALSFIYVLLQYDIALRQHRLYADADADRDVVGVDRIDDRPRTPPPEKHGSKSLEAIVPIDSHRPKNTGPQTRKKNSGKNNNNNNNNNSGGGGDSSSEAAKTMIPINSRERRRLQRAASIDYFACCGAGHRLSKLADAYYVAKQLGFAVRVFFGFCDHQEVFSDLFGPKPLNEDQVLSTIREGFRTGHDMNILPDMYLRISNDVPGFRRLTRHGRSNGKGSGGGGGGGTNATATAGTGTATPCPCLGYRDRFESDVELFTDLRDRRFRDRDKVDAFRRTFFAGHTVIGLHVRAGNGEDGDFVRKNRIIEDIDRWCLSMANTLISLSKDFEAANEPPVVFIATDTARVISELRTLLEGKLRVLDFGQDRIEPGGGILFGEAGKVDTSGSRCRLGWRESLADMMLLSHADVLVAGRPSSFTQGLPMTLVLAAAKTTTTTTPASARNNTVVVRKPYCEANPTATALECFGDLADWCCNGTTSFSLGTTTDNNTITQAYEYRRMPPARGLDLDNYRSRIRMRPRGLDDCVPTTQEPADCLPYEMPDETFLVRLQQHQHQQHRP